MTKFNPLIVCCYLYPITRYGYPPSAEKTRQYITEMKALGFSSIELEGIRETHLSAVYHHRIAIYEKVEELGVKIPYFCTVLPGLSSIDRNERSKNLDLFEKGCIIAKQLNSKGIIDNGPIPPYRFPRDIPVTRHYDEEVLYSAQLPDNLKWEFYWKDLIETYRSLCDIAADYQLTFHVHPCQGVLAATTDAFLYFYSAVDRKNLRFNFDTANQFFLREDLDLSMRRLHAHVDYIHLSDNRGSRVEHLIPGKGKINWEKFFNTLKTVGYQGDFGIDVGGAESNVQDLESAYTESAKWLENNWYKKYQRSIL